MRPQRWFGTRPEALLPRLLLLLVVALVIRRWVWAPILVKGESMRPALRSGQLALVNKLAYRSELPRRGDIVILWTGEELWVKRVLGLPGEEIAVRRGTLYINGDPLREPYVVFNNSCDVTPGKLAANHFLLAGDNRQPALLLVVSRERIVGRLMGVRNVKPRL